jgi:small subunit ribosomal protein S20
MANIKSAIKRLRQSKIRHLRNKAGKTYLRSSIKKVRLAIESGDRSLAQTLLPKALSAIDRAAAKKIITRNTASRYKSRLSRRVDALLKST